MNQKSDKVYQHNLSPVFKWICVKKGIAMDVGPDHAEPNELPPQIPLPAISEMANADFSEYTIPLLAGSAFADNLGSNVYSAFKQVASGLQLAEKLAQTLSILAD